MSDFNTVIERLHQTRLYRHAFVCLWAFEEALILPGLDRVAADINSCGHGSVCAMPEASDPGTDEGM